MVKNKLYGMTFAVRDVPSKLLARAKMLRATNVDTHVENFGNVDACCFEILSDTQIVDADLNLRASIAECGLSNPRRCTNLKLIVDSREKVI
jgi:hypothetical protein